jgi:hypothetical protein
MTMGLRLKHVWAGGPIAAAATVAAIGAANASQNHRRVFGKPPAATPTTRLVDARWSIWPRSPLGRRYAPTVVWDGHELLEVGGGRRRSQPQSPGATAAFNPATRTWRRLDSAPRQVALLYGASVWAGRQLFMFGGQSLSGPGPPACCHAALLDPTTGHWSLTASAPLDPLDQPTAVWTGTRVLVAGVSGNRTRLEVASFDPATGAWQRIDPPSIAGHAPLGLALVATGQRALLWSLWSRSAQTGSNTFTVYSGVDVFRLSPAGPWHDVTGHWPQHETVSSPVFTGRDVLLPPGQIWCGACSHPAPYDEHGYVVDPATLHRTQIPHGRLDDLGPSIVWTGAVEISLNQGGEISGPHIHVLPGDVSSWNPATNRWTRRPRAPAVPESLPVWDGVHLLTLAADGRVLAYGR